MEHIPIPPETEVMYIDYQLARLRKEKVFLTTQEEILTERRVELVAFMAITAIEDFEQDE